MSYTEKSLQKAGKNKNLCSPWNLLQAVYMFMESISEWGRMDWLHMPLQFRGDD